MLNQVVPRHAAAMVAYEGVNAGAGLLEDGKFGAGTKQAIGVFKQHFGFNGDATLGDDVAALREEYSIDARAASPANPLLYANGSFDPTSVVGSYLLLHGSPGSFDASHRCFGQTSLANPTTPCDTINAGLYEIYENIVRVFIDRKIEAMESYVELGSPVDAGYWQSRPFGAGGIVDFRQVVPATQAAAAGYDAAYQAQVAALDDGRNGVSYCFGCTQMTQFVAAAFERNASYWSLFSDFEKLNTFETTVVSAAPPGSGQVPTGWRPNLDTLVGRYAGRTQAELDDYTADYAPPEYRHDYWAGIDCSGFTWVAADYAVRGDASLESWVHPLWPGYPEEIAGPRTQDLGPDHLGRSTVTVAALSTLSHQLGGEQPAHHWVYVSTVGIDVHVGLRGAVRRGDVLSATTHTGAAYSDGGVPRAPLDNARIWSIEAAGAPDTYSIGTSDVSSEKFGRKAIVRDLAINGAFRPRRVMREALWR